MERSPDNKTLIYGLIGSLALIGIGAVAYLDKFWKKH